MEAIGNCNQIPKIIHQIWLGPREIPNKWMNSWVDFCKKFNWEYKLWRDSNMINLINQDIFDSCNTYQMKSDIARYEIIYNYGGVYIDCDMIWLGKDIQNYLHLDKNMFIGIQEFPSWLDIGYHNLCNGMFASPKKHKVLKRCIEKIPEYSKNLIKKIQGPWSMTGPGLLNSCILEPIIVVPYTYIFPVDFHYQQSIEDPCYFKEDAIVFTYNGNDYPGVEKSYLSSVLLLLVSIAFLFYLTKL